GLPPAGQQFRPLVAAGPNRRLKWDGERGIGGEAVPKKTTLPNGIRGLSDRVAGVRSVSVGVWAAVGSRDETAGKGGLAHLIEHMMFKGTTRRSARVIAETIDATR